MVLPQAGRVILSAPMSFCFSFCLLMQKKDFTYSNNNMQTFIVFLKQRHFEGKYITTSHHYICHDTQICDRSYDNGICASFIFVGKESKKSNPVFISLLGIDTSFVPAPTTSLGLDRRAVPIKIWSYFYSELEDHNPRSQCAQ